MADEAVSVTVALGAAGVYPPIEWQGKTYLLGHPTQVAKADFEVGVIEAEKRAISQQLKYGVITPAEAAAEKSKLGVALDRGDYRTGKPLWLAYTFFHPETGDTSRVMTGLLLYVHGLLKQKQPEITFAETQALWDGAADDLKLAMKQVVPDFFAWAGGAMGLPPEATAEIAKQVAERVGSALPTPTTPPPTPSS